MEGYLHSVDDRLADDVANEVVEVSPDKLKANPEDLEARVSLGRSYFEQGMVGAARKEFERVAQVISDNIISYKLLGKIYESEGREEEAARLYRIFSAFDSEVNRILNSRGAEEPAKGRKPPGGTRPSKGKENSNSKTERVLTALNGWLDNL